MVVAGPGTGKTELLALRVANILKRTDALADNILCLTFTESGASAMRSRLVELMGREAYRVNVHTFHSLGSEIINTQPGFFYSGAEFRPADELSTYQILSDIFRTLPHDNPLASRSGEDFTQLSQTAATISDFKRSGLTPDEIQRIIKSGDGFIDYMGAAIKKTFSIKIDKMALSVLPSLLEKMKAYKADELPIATIRNLSDIATESFDIALHAALSRGKTTAVTAWRNMWLEKDSKGDFVFKDIRRHKKLLAASHVYGEYLRAMQDAKLYDYDDMILRVVHALEVFPELRYNLQERYQYILADEFQDTNGAQMRILHSLSTTPHHDAPNMMVVGDDDQAIYRFQGAQVSNILDFQRWLKNPTVITLRENYRSTKSILSRSREVIRLGHDRLETALEDINKTLHANLGDQPGKLTLHECSSVAQEHSSQAKAIKQKLEQGGQPRSTAVLVRSHKEIAEFLPYLALENIPFSYERKENILEDESVALLLKLASVVVNMGTGRLSQANAALPEILAHPAWGIEAPQLWDLSVDSYKNNRLWLETMRGAKPSSHLYKLAHWLIQQAQDAAHLPLEYVLDSLLGSRGGEGEFTSPLKEYFFSPKKLGLDGSAYLRHLHALTSLRQAARDFRPNTPLALADLVEYVQLTKQAGLKLENYYQAPAETGKVSVMTAHRAKGLEFDSVFILGAVDKTWGLGRRGRMSRLSYPANMAIGPAGDNYDDQLRLFFVAMTRAKTELSISYALKDQAGKDSARADFLSDWPVEVAQPPQTLAPIIEASERAWQSGVLPADSASLRENLAPLLKDYQLSVTHLNSFLDVTRGGPQHFLMRNLLHFPESISPSAALGSAVHKTLQRAGAHLKASKQQRPLEDILYDFETFLKAARLSEDDFTHQLQRGSVALSAFVAHGEDLFKPSQLLEFNFKQQGVVLGDAHLTGIIDVIDKNDANKTLTLSDYKTGKPAPTWQGRTDYEKIKLHKYKQQLLFYKLLAEGSRELRGFTAVLGQLLFVEPDTSGKILELSIDYRPEDLAQFKALLGAVWHRIMRADFPDTSHYEQSYKGILAFERDLLE